MNWKIELTVSAKKELNKLDSVIQKRITKFLYEKLIQAPNPRIFGHSLTGNFSGHWRYRVGDYRIICRILDTEIVIEIIKIAHRADVYD
jgi:mRNA interferase RelE/StbE